MDEINMRFNVEGKVLLFKINAKEKRVDVLEIYKEYNKEYEIAGFHYSSYIFCGIVGDSYWHHRLELAKKNPEEWSRGSYYSMNKVEFLVNGEHSTVIHIPIWIVTYGVDLGGFMNYNSKTIAYIREEDYKKLIS